MGEDLKKYDWELVFNIITRSHSINKHLDFFNWLQNSVSKVLPHDVLVAAWGDFDTGEITFDVSSNISDVCTQKLIGAPEVFKYLMTNLHQRWVKNDNRWYAIHKFDIEGISSHAPTPFMRSLSSMKSVLVYGVKDMRGKSDCMYVFFDRKESFNVATSVMGLIMPHLDAALRRVEYIETPLTDEELVRELTEISLSDREHEILNWVRSGKTNFEIGMILMISPNTVKNHLKRIFQKLDVSSRAQAVAKFSTPHSSSRFKRPLIAN